MALTARSIQKVTRYICILLFGLAFYKIIQNYTNISKEQLINIAESVENTFESDLEQILLIHAENEKTPMLNEGDIIHQSPTTTLSNDEVDDGGSTAKSSASWDRNLNKDINSIVESGESIKPSDESDILKVSTLTSSSNTSQTLKTLASQGSKLNKDIHSLVETGNSIRTSDESDFQRASKLTSSSNASQAQLSSQKKLELFLISLLGKAKPSSYFAKVNKSEPRGLPMKESDISVSSSQSPQRETTTVTTQNEGEGKIMDDTEISRTDSRNESISGIASAESSSDLSSIPTESMSSESLMTSKRSDLSELLLASISDPNSSQSLSTSTRADLSEFVLTAPTPASESSSTSNTGLSSLNPSQTCTDSTRKKIAWSIVPRWIKDYPNEEMFKDCDFSCCSIDFSATYTDYNQSKDLDAIFFDAHTLLAPEPLQRPSFKDQIWIFFSLEPPPFISRTQWTQENWRHVFNWTMTYRTDSDLVTPYMAVEKNVNDPHYVPKDYDLIMAKKTKKAMWLCSHCVDKHGRMSYVEKLKESIQIDVFGKCGNLKCELTCDAIYDMYKFFIAFENAYCKDYITEKPCNALIRDIIPVVRGGVKHSEFLPPNTYIDANDFESVEDLGKYLNYLDSNDTAYLEYLKNKEGYRFRCNSMITRKPMYCDLCKKLHNLDVYAKSIPDITQWLQSCSDEVKVTFDNRNNFKYFK